MTKKLVSFDTATGQLPSAVEAVLDTAYGPVAAGATAAALIAAEHDTERAHQSSTYVPQAQTQPASGTPVPMWAVQPAAPGAAPFKAFVSNALFATIQDPLSGHGYNADLAFAGEPVLREMFEANYRAVNWRTSGQTEDTMEWYVEYHSPDHATVTDFRPFGFTVGRGSNAARWATVAIDIGTDAAPLRSAFLVLGTAGQLLNITNTGAGFGLPVVFNSSIRLNGPVLNQINHGDGVAAGDLYYTNNVPLANSGGITWDSAGVGEWKFVRAGGANILYLNDIVNNVNQMTHVQGTATTGYTALGVALRLHRGATAARPVAATVGYGAMFYDATLAKPIWSDGSGWRDAMANVV